MSADRRSGRLTVAVVAAAGLVSSFAVAQATGVRALGAVVLVGAGLWCAWRLVPTAGVLRTVVVGLAYAVAFAVAHPLGTVIGSWTAVICVSVLTGALAWALGARGAEAIGP